MSEKRKDSKGRLLRNGEVQRTDGKYMFRYTDLDGTRKTIYSWKLVDTDVMPNGKKDAEALRDMEKRINRDLDDGILTHQAKNLTVNDMFDLMMETKVDLRESTRCLYIGLYNNHLREAVGYRALDSVKFSQLKKLYLSILNEGKLKPSSIIRLHVVLYQIFDLAVKDDIIRKNPAAGVPESIKQLTNIDNKRHALTEEQQERFISYVYSTGKFRRWGPLFTVMLGTGMRVGEALGLRWCDCDFDAMKISVNHTIRYGQFEAGGYGYRIEQPKTSAGVREIPMFLDVYNALLEMKRVKSRQTGKPFEVNGYTDFIFLNNNGKVFTNATVFHTLHSISDEYNKEELLMAKSENRDPCLMPKFSSHILRHTFCTRMCENEPNVKVIQEVMGHKRISTTMDTYNEATDQKKRETFSKLEGKIKLA